VNCSSLPTVHKLLLTKCCESSYLTLCCIALQRTDWFDRDWNEQSGFAMLKLTPISCPVEAVQILLKVTWRLQLRCKAVFMTSSPSSAPRFSLLAVIFRTTLNKSTYRRFQQHPQKAPLCSGISFHLDVFIFTYSSAFAIP